MVRVFIYLFNAVFLVILAWIVSRIFGAAGRGNVSRGDRVGGTRPGGRPEFRGETARDPVCGMFVSTELSRRLERNGEVLHFCSDECMEKYRAEATRV